MKKYFILITLLTLVIFACTKIYVEPFQQLTDQCRNTLEQSLGCKGVQSNYYFHGFLDGKEVCFSENVDNYTPFDEVSESFTTNGPVLNPNDPATAASRKIQLEFGIRAKDYDQRDNSPYFSIIVSTKYAANMVDFLLKNIKLGNLPFQQQFNGDSAQTAGFNIRIKDYCKDVNNLVPKPDSSTFFHPFRAWVYSYWTIGDQTNSSFKCTEFEETEDSKNYYFNASFEVNCNLYTNLSIWHRLKDGVFKTRFTVKK